MSHIDGVLRLTLLGPPSLVDETGAVPQGLGPGKSLAVLCYLARRGSARREELAALLWGDVDEERARNAFRQTLHRLRSVLGPEVLPHERETVRLLPGDRLRVDLTAFETALEAGQVDEAVAAYTGDFLEGFDAGTAEYAHWADAERMRLRVRYQTILERATQDALASGAWDAAIRHARRLALAAPLDADAALLEANALASAGRHGEALGVLRAFAARCTAELGGELPGKIAAAMARLDHEKAQPRRGDTETTSSPRRRVPASPRQEAFVGRDGEMARLLALWRGVTDGAGAVVVVEGVAGAGKTRLADEFAARASTLSHALVLGARERLSGGALAYAPIADALRQALGARGLAGASAHLLAEAARLVPELRDRFSLPPAAPVHDEAARLRFFEGIAAVLDAIAYEQPVCLLLDDLQHSAPATLELIRYLTARLRGSPILFVLCGRAGGVSQPWAGSMAAERIELQPLDTAEPGTALVHFRDVLGSRLESCTPAARRLFLAAALIGRPAALRTLAAATHLAEPAALDAALELQQAGLLLQAGVGVAPAHELAAELALEQAGAATCALIAGWTADALAHARAAPDAELAELYERAGRREAAHQHARAAAEAALALGAREQAIRMLRLAAASAPDAHARAEASARLAALGEGVRRIAAGRARVEELARRSHVRPQLLAGAAAVVAIATPAASAIIFQAAREAGPRGHVLADSLILLETTTVGRTAAFKLSGSLASAASALQATSVRAAGASWLDSLRHPWLNPLPDPTGRYVAVQRMTSAGPDLYVISADRRDTLGLATGPGDDIPLGWSPDGRQLLVAHGRTLGNREYDTDLVAYTMTTPAHAVPIDTAAERAVVAAAWSPDGTRIAWSARTGVLRQLDVFVSYADGSELRNLTDHPAEDYHPAWSPDGARVAFTSEREGNAELYALELESGRLWRLTFDAAQDDRPAFSPNGEFIAFESTRGGEPGVYVVASWGGEPARVTPRGRPMAHAGWRGTPPPYLEDLRVQIAAALRPGESATVEAEAYYTDGTPRQPSSLTWSTLDPELIEIRGASAGNAPATRVVAGLRAGLARIVVAAAGWRADTSYIKVGDDAMLLLSDDFERAALGTEAWLALGEPAPEIEPGAGRDNTRGLVLNADRQWESGILSSETFPLQPSSSLTAWVRAPFAAPAAGGTALTVALVQPVPDGLIERDAPSFTVLASFSWRGDAARLAYAVEREVFTEPVSRFDSPAQVVRIELETDGRVAFYVDGERRWRSTLRLAQPPGVARARVWVGGQATGAAVVVDDIALRIGGG